MPTPNVRLRHERQLRGWSQAHLAEQIDVPDYYISRWERGEVLPSPYYQQKLCEVFGKTAEELGMLQTTPLTLPVDPPQLVEQLPFPEPQVHPISSPQPLKQPRPTRKGKSLVLQAFIILVLAGTGLGIIFFSRANPMTVSVVVGHLYFLSSGQTSVNSNQGIADEVRIELQSPQSPSHGKSYYAWLLPDENNPENQVFLLGKVVISGGNGYVTYNDAQYTNLLAVTSQLLITEQDDVVPPPLSYSTDKNDWRYVAKIPQIIPSGQQYSLLDHLRHLLAKDPTLEEHGLPGGIAIWLYRNTQKIYQWSIHAVNLWQSEGKVNVSLIRQDIISLLDYLDGLAYVGKDLPSTTQVPVDARMGTFGLLQIDPQQQLKGYLQHMSFHLNGLTASPGANNLMRERANEILIASNTVDGWFEQIRQDAKRLAAMKDDQLRQQQALTLLNDIENNANFALNGEVDPMTGNTKQGVEWIYETTLSLATMDITSFRE